MGTSASIVLSVAVVCLEQDMTGLQRLLRSLNEQSLEREIYDVCVIAQEKTRELNQVIHDSSLLMPVSFCRNTLGGINGARDCVIRTSDASKLLFLTDRMIAPPTLIENHIKAHEKHPHCMIRGPILPLDVKRINPCVPELHGMIHMPSLYFETNNTSFPKVGLAKVNGFKLHVDSDYEDIEIYYRLLEENFREVFSADLYCYENEETCVIRNLQAIRDRARLQARCAALHYMSNHTPKIAKIIGATTGSRVFSALTSNYLMHQLYASMIIPDRIAAGILESPCAQRLFEYYYNKELNKELQERHL